MAKKKANKAQVSNKAEKATVENKAAKSSIDWSKQPEKIIIVGLGKKNLIEGKEYPVSKQSAKTLIEKGIAKLK